MKTIKIILIIFLFCCLSSIALAGFSTLETFEFGTKGDVTGVPTSFSTISTISFGTKGELYPVIYYTNPGNESTGVDIFPVLTVGVEHSGSTQFNISWSTNATTDWV